MLIPAASGPLGGGQGHLSLALTSRVLPEGIWWLLGFGRFVASTTSGIATRPGRPLPGQDSHLLDQRAFHGARYSQNGPQGLIGRTKPGRVPCTGSR